MSRRKMYRLFRDRSKAFRYDWQKLKTDRS